MIARVARTAVLLKYVPLHAPVDPLTGVAPADPHGGLSAADRCALALAVRTGDHVTAVNAGSTVVEGVLRDALAAGAHRAVWVRMPPEASSAQVARELAGVVDGADLIWAGDYSTDRGSGSVPAFVAAELGIAQALGLSGVESGEPFTVRRRLDGGRQEVLRIDAPAVLSVEAGLASLPRASMAAVLAARDAPIEHIDAHAVPAIAGHAAPFRARPRVLPGPDARLSARERVVALSGALVDHDPPRVVRAEPAQAAAELLEFLRTKGFRA